MKISRRKMLKVLGLSPLALKAAAAMALDLGQTPAPAPEASPVVETPRTGWLEGIVEPDRVEIWDDSGFVVARVSTPQVLKGSCLAERALMPGDSVVFGGALFCVVFADNLLVNPYGKPNWPGEVVLRWKASVQGVRYERDL